MMITKMMMMMMMMMMIMIMIMEIEHCNYNDDDNNNDDDGYELITILTCYLIRKRQFFDDAPIITEQRIQLTPNSNLSIIRHDYRGDER